MQLYIVLSDAEYFFRNVFLFKAAAHFVRSLADSLPSALSSYVLCSNFVFKIAAWAVSLHTAWQLLKNSVLPLLPPTNTRLFLSYVHSDAFWLHPKIRNEWKKGNRPVK
jgi:hypothetical protein